MYFNDKHFFQADLILGTRKMKGQQNKMPKVECQLAFEKKSFVSFKYIDIPSVNFIFEKIIFLVDWHFYLFYLFYTKRCLKQYEVMCLFFLFSPLDCKTNAPYIRESRDTFRCDVTEHETSKSNIRTTYVFRIPQLVEFFISISK